MVNSSCKVTRSCTACQTDLAHPLVEPLSFTVRKDIHVSTNEYDKSSLLPRSFKTRVIELLSAISSCFTI